MDWREWDALHATRRGELDFSLLWEAAIARKRWWLGLPLTIFALVAAVLWLQTPLYSAEALISIGPGSGGLTGLRRAAYWDDSAGCGAAIGGARLISSRDLARKAIKDLGIEESAEFDPAAKGLGPAFRALIFLGVMGDPARQSQEDRLLEAFQKRLSVSGPGRRGLISVAFRSQDAELSAKAANRVAELFLAMRADAGEASPCDGKARIVAPAIPPQAPVYPREGLLMLSGATMIVMGLGACAAIALPLFPSFRRQDDFLEELGAAAYQSENECQRWPACGPQALADEPLGKAAEDEQALAKIVARIRAQSAPATRGVRLLATSLEASGPACSMALDLARTLARDGHAIAIALDAQSARELSGAMAAGADLGELLNGSASFAEVIQRDPTSRLHFLPVGHKREIDLHEFNHVVDALAAAYDFVIVLAPPLGENEAAKILAPTCDLALLAAPAGASGRAIEAERELVESGVGDVLPVSLGSDAERRSASGWRAADMPEQRVRIEDRAVPSI